MWEKGKKRCLIGWWQHPVQENLATCKSNKTHSSAHCQEFFQTIQPFLFGYFLGLSETCFSQFQIVSEQRGFLLYFFHVCKAYSFISLCFKTSTKKVESGSNKLSSLSYILFLLASTCQTITALLLTSAGAAQAISK